MACAWTSRTAVPAAVDRPAYSAAATPMSAVEVALAVMVGLVPPPAVIGALHTDSAVPSPAFQTPTSTTIRSPVVTDDPGVTLSDPACPCADTCCTNDGATFEGVTALDGAEAGPVPIAFVAVTVKV